MSVFKFFLLNKKNTKTRPRMPEKAIWSLLSLQPICFSVSASCIVALKHLPQIFFHDSQPGLISLSSLPGMPWSALPSALRSISWMDSFPFLSSAKRCLVDTKKGAPFVCLIIVFWCCHLAFPLAFIFYPPLETFNLSFSHPPPVPQQSPVLTFASYFGIN